MRILPLLPLLLAFVACQEQEQEQERKPEAIQQARAEEACAKWAKRIDEFLGKKFAGPVAVRIVDLDFIADFMRETEEKMIPPGLEETTRKLAVRMHLVPPGYDIQTQQIELMREMVAGLYDPEKDCFYVVEKRATPGTPEFDITTAHELIHAYRDIDTRFHEKTCAAVLEQDLDWAVAISCLVEGDATLLSLALAASAVSGRKPKESLDAMVALDMDFSDLPTPAGAKDFPFAMREMMLGRYLIGMTFATEVYRQGGLAALAKAYDRPPRSSEQVLHPAKYLAEESDEPTVFSGGDPTAALGDGWKLSASGTLGEFETVIQFTELLGRERAAKAGAGWDGARFHFCEKEGVPSFVGLSSTWDSEKDAEEFASAWLDWCAKRDGAEGTRSAGRVQTKEGLVAVTRRGRDVLVADGVPPDRVEAVFAALAAARRTERASDAVPGRR